MTAIAMQGVNKWYGALHALRDVTLSVDKGETVVICGPSGSGKSTLIRTLNALEPVDEGAITVAGVRLDGPKAVHQVRRKVGMVFQAFNLFTHLRVIDNLTLAPETLLGLSRKAVEARALALLDRVGLADQARKFPGQLSGGQQQRVAITRTLMMEPEVLLFDEPTSALDPEMVHEVLHLMEALAREGRTMICVSHEMGFARNVADRVVFMVSGCVVEQATPEQFFDTPRSDAAQTFLSQVLY